MSVGLFVRLEAKPGKEKQVAEFLRQALPLVEAEPHTVDWFAIKMGPSTFAIYDTFADNAGRQEHLSGKVAAALMARASDLLASPPSIEKVDILAVRPHRKSTSDAGTGEHIPMQVGSELHITNQGAISVGNPEMELAAASNASDAVLSYRFDAAAGVHVLRLLEPVANRKHIAAHRPGD